MDINPLDVDLAESMDAMFNILSVHPDNKDSADQLRMRIVAYNLCALANVVLIADDNQEVVELNLKQITLGLLGTSDWMMKNLPLLDEEM